jgi:hypothetical protein
LSTVQSRDAPYSREIDLFSADTGTGGGAHPARVVDLRTRDD